LRVAILAVWVVMAVVALLPILRGRSVQPPGPPLSTDELVKDPVCQTYIVRSRAVTRQTAAGARYFCSAACADRFAG
jgi:YHS domain-containing protein